MSLDKKRFGRYVSIIAINLCLLGLFLFNVNVSALNSKPAEFDGNALTYVSNPTYDYSYAQNLSVNYTYHTYFYLTANQTVTFETAKSGTNPDMDTVMYLFKETGATATSSWYNDDYTGYYSRISVTIPSTDYYHLLVRGYNNASGYASLYKDGALYNSAIKVGGKMIATSKNKTGMLNYFTANRNGADTVLWVLDSSQRVLAMNDDYQGNGIFGWDLGSRIRASLASNIAYAIIGTYNSAQTGTVDVYLQCNDGITYSSYFPKLYADDSIKADNASSVYNCISWAGGITDTWINPNFTLPDSSLSPWYNLTDNTAAFDNYFGNNPLRYTGAPTYVNTSNYNESVIDLWMSGGAYTHAPVRKPANNMPHGYDWESKLGSDQRIFHPRSALTGNLYGIAVRYYKPATGVVSFNEIMDTPVNKAGFAGMKAGARTRMVQYQLDNAMTFEESVAKGLTTTQNITLTAETLAKLDQMKSSAGSEVAEQFQGLYQKWVESVKASPELMLSNNSEDYLKIREYKPLELLLRSQGKKMWGLLIDKYLQEESVFAQTLVNRFIVAYNNDTINLAGKIRERNNQTSRNSLTSAVYIAPTYETNVMCFINEIINPSTGR